MFDIIRQRARSLPIRIRWIIGVTVLLIIGIFFYRFIFSGSKTLYKEFTIKKQDILISTLSTGTVQPENRLEIKTPVSGRIDTVLVQEGLFVKKGQVLAWMSSTERAALIDAARSQGPEEVKKWEEIYRPTPIVAPLPGMIIRRDIEPGQTITSAEAILVMSDRLTVKAQVDETDLAKIKMKQQALITLDAYPDIRIPARVDQIAYEAKTVNNVTTYVVDVLPAKAPELMRSGMTANVSFLFDKKEGVLAVPNEVLVLKDGITKVLRKTKGQTPEEVVVTTGATNGKVTEVISTLAEGDIVLRVDVQALGSGGKNPFSPMGSGRRTPGMGR